MLCSSHQNLPAILSIDEAIEAKSFMGTASTHPLICSAPAPAHLFCSLALGLRAGQPHTLAVGNLDEGFKESDRVLEGQCRMGGQVRP